MIVAYDGSGQYDISRTGELFWSIFDYANLALIYIYPEFFRWFRDKVVANLANGSRSIYAAYSTRGKLAGYMILKNDGKEQKICTLQIFPGYRKLGYGRDFFAIALEKLQSPVITVNDAQMDLYSRLLEEYGFSLVGRKAEENIFQKIILSIKS